MKRVRVVCAGKLKESYLREGVAEYQKRLGAYCALSIVELPDLMGADAVKRESESLLAKRRGFTVLLDAGGTLLTSEELAATLDRAYLRTDEVTFIIGGSRGVDDTVRQAADLTVSFGRLTYPHRLMRLLLSEQIYRAFTILAGTPYHK
ncbi:MAG: 23S rRNA (pseudouridine(1915)-N(3))-methyltransferase RlmH [Clostridiales bacterium]|jgi:23S rRNA (pseudouridine1915-N3)-methyltransferase|nr:23S rRNA (pseudouridine(1915)-N(3))-methyltransferase RlmH [Clostridiales bacterium]